ncbi:TIGR04282 family arsenosugar biosynthesis glycosyltransferase [Ulvibacterium sp.]|uniref:TIGR04282 family arsenosugar biosynthesis glycosyltransferase n=1 Tax=Ulvibacterium sp. TaxID=2665914 RepID=UPI003BAC8CED
MARVIHQKTAILLFANSGKEELKHKPVENGAGLFDELTKYTLGEVEKTGLPFFHLTEKHQKGDSFGERFAHAIQAIFDKGYDSIITLGNDTPHLHFSHIQEAHAQLKSKKLVLGPSVDGGFYLMGIHRSQFHAVSFANLPWQTSKLFKAIIDWADIGEEELTRLQPLIDLDQLHDVRNLLSRFRTFPKAVLRLLVQIIYRRVQKYGFVPTSIDSHFLHIPFNKGSPALFAVGIR